MKILEKEQQSYKQFIDEIIENRGRFGCGEAYHEKHHIVPKCLGGTNEDDNLIDLYAKEHFVAHMLLAKENPHEQGLQYAWWMMAHVINKETQERYECSPEEYEQAKIAISNTMTGENNPVYGKHWKLSEETKEKMSKAKMGFEHSEKTKQKLKELALGRDGYWKGKHLSEETKKKISENHAHLSGEYHPLWGKHHSEETKKKISESKIGEKNPMWGRKQSEETCKKIGEAQRGEQNHNYGKNTSEDVKKKMRISHCKYMVKCVETGKLYYGAREAAKDVGMKSYSGITRCCNHKGLKTSGGYHWEYIDKDEVSYE